MAEDLSRLVRERLAQAMGVPAERLLNDTELGDEFWEDGIVEPLCEELGIDPDVLFPLDGPPPRSEFAAWGLRRLAPWSERAASRLKELERRWEVPTVGSLIRSLEERRYVGSGRVEVIRDDPMPPIQAATRFAGWTAMVGTALSLGLWADCNPACRVCAPLGDVASSLGFPLALALVGGWHALILGAALRELGRPQAATASA